jgi:predicted nucleic acid-binding protein
VRVQRVYVDTSVIGGCYDPEFSIWSNGLIQDFRDSNYKPVLSEVVAAKVKDAPQPIQETYAEILNLHADFIQITPEAVELSDAYQERRILPAKFASDALHIALATVAEVDVLVSWNFKHIVHFDKIRLFNAVNLELGFKQLQIYSPREVTTYEKNVSD